MIREMIARVVDRTNLREEEMVAVMRAIMTGEVTNAQIGAFIMGLRMKGETVDEIVGAARVMREMATRIPVSMKDQPVVDTCGTGGDGTMTFNISTAAAFVAAAGGVKVAKHGNRSVSGMCGSADVLERVGVNLNCPPGEVARHIGEVGIGFMFAPAFHLSMKNALGPRREMGIRTIFNILGPLTNPAGAKHHLLGVYREELCEVMAQVLIRLGAERAMVVHGSDGLDEISVAAPTTVWEIRDGWVRDYLIEPGSFGFRGFSREELKGGGADENAAILKGVLSGNANGARRAVIALNAGAVFYLTGRCGNLSEGVRLAGEIVASGKAMDRLEALVAVSGK